MKHRIDCPGDCGIWTDRLGVEWNVCRMTSRRLFNLHRYLLDNSDRLEEWAQFTAFYVERELVRRGFYVPTPLSA